MKVLISDKSSPKCAQILREAGHEVDEITGLSPEELIKIIGKYDGLIVRSATKATSEILQAADNLKVIGRAGSGVDNIDLKAATEKNVVVMNTPGGNSNAVAELSIGQMIALGRHFYPAAASLKAERWEKKKFGGFEIYGKTLGILGYGTISRLVANKALALGMEVFIYDPKIQKNLVDSDGLNLSASLTDVLAKADYISVHLTKKPETVDFINKEQFQQMKKGVFFVNNSRGGVVNEQALVSALDEGIVAAAAVDVYVKEPPADFSLAKHEKVLCTPHIGASTKEAQIVVAVKVAEQFVDMFAGKGIRNQVN